MIRVCSAMLAAAVVLVCALDAAAEEPDWEDLLEFEALPLDKAKELERLLDEVADDPEVKAAIEVCGAKMTAEAESLAETMTSARTHATDAGVSIPAKLPSLDGRGPGVGPAAVEGFAGLQDVVLRGVYTFIAQRAEAEVVQFAVRELKSHLCRTERLPEVFPATCGVVDEVRGDDLGLATLQRALVQDLRELPTPLSRVLATGASFEGREGLVCGLATSVALERTLGAPMLLDDSAALAFATALQTPSCRGALAIEKARARQYGGWLTLVAASIGPGSRPEEVIAALSAEIADEVGDWCAEPANLDEARRLHRFMTSPAARNQAKADPSRPLAHARTNEEILEAGATRLAAHIKVVEEERATLLEPARKRAVEPAASVAVGSFEPLTALVRYGRAAGTASTEAERATATRDITTAWLRLGSTAFAATSSARDHVPVSRAIDVLAAGTAFRTGEFESALSALMASGWFVGATGEARNLAAASSLMAGIVSADSPEDVRKALGEASESRGSWGRRRDGFAWGLSAMFGASAGAELVTDAEQAFYAGAYVPIGFTLSVPAGGWALGLLAQVLDFGSAASVQLGGDELDSAKLSLAQLFSPGLNLFVGVGDSPFAVSLHGSFTPSLRESAGEPLDAWRAGLALGVDIPLLFF